MAKKPTSAKSGFLRLCRAFSGQIYAQGFGGNISAKHGRKMLIKASGRKLSQVGDMAGFAELDWAKIASIYRGAKRASESEASKSILSAMAAGNREKPSMEAGFHSFLGKYVAHLHPVHLNVILCQKDAKRLLGEIFGERNFVFVPYARPGHKLAMAVWKKARQGGSRAIFLQNHGVIVSCPSASKCIAECKDMERAAARFLRSRIRGFDGFGAWKTRNPKILASPPMFPDAALLMPSAKKPAPANPIVRETFIANCYIHHYAKALGKPKPLSKKQAAELFLSSDERHRLGLAGV